MENKTISDYLKGEDPEKVERFRDYCNFLRTDKKKGGELKNPWMKHRTPEQLSKLYKKVALDGFEFDGVHITLQSTGVSYDYIAYKNMMYKIYPESIIDVQLVYKEDEFDFRKESGRIYYNHEFKNPFGQTEKDIIGAYCIIKNKRGEFISLLSASDINKHRKVAKTDYIWKNWFNEMALKTIIKKACKAHFADIYQNIETLDNESYDLEKATTKKTISENQLYDLIALIDGKKANVEKMFKFFEIDKWEELTVDEYPKVIEMIEAIE